MIVPSRGCSVFHPWQSARGPEICRSARRREDRQAWGRARRRPECPCEASDGPQAERARVAAPGAGLERACVPRVPEVSTDEERVRHKGLTVCRGSEASAVSQSSIL